MTTARDAQAPPTSVGWIGVGRMGSALVRRLLDAGYDVAVYNRTRSKAEPLAEYGAKVVDRPVDLADRDVVFIMVSASADLEAVTIGDGGRSRLGVPRRSREREPVGRRRRETDVGGLGPAGGVR
jgi:glutamyl-tRNA reductase